MKKHLSYDQTICQLSELKHFIAIVCQDYGGSIGPWVEQRGRESTESLTLK